MATGRGRRRSAAWPSSLMSARSARVSLSQVSSLSLAEGRSSSAAETGQASGRGAWLGARGRKVVRRG
eukprot:648029-Pleurochrysis_carterae.AAC.2